MNPPLSKCVIVANGVFHSHPLPLAALRGARRVIGCDGAAEKLEAAGFEPDWIVGDLDSLSDASRARYRDRLVAVSEQASNDLAKAFRFCFEQGWHDVVIVGATGLREDHTLGNLAWLADFALALHAAGTAHGCGRIVLLTDTGIFTPALASMAFRSYAGQQVSIFSFEAGVQIYADGLKYALDGVPFTRWWQAALNESLGETFKLVFEGGPLLVFQTY